MTASSLLAAVLALGPSAGPGDAPPKTQAVTQPEHPVQRGRPAPMLAPKRSARAERRAVRYEVRIPAPTSQYVEVVMTVRRAATRSTDVAMPAWTPGSYLIRDYARHVDGLRATDLDGRPLPVEKRDKQTWRVGNRRRGFVVRYRVFADRRGVRGNFVDDLHALIASPALFLYVPGQTDRPADVRFELPPGWQANGPLPERAAPAPIQEFAAPSYDRLADSPFILGAPEVLHFTVAGRRVELVYSAPEGSNVDLTRVGQDVFTIVQTYARMMGGLPFERYALIFEAAPRGDGGLEHRDSAMMMVNRDMFADEAGYRSLRRLVAHEFFHLWNVKRIHDRVLGPFDYSREVHSRLLWFHEGCTETVEALALVRAGMVPAEAFVRSLAGRWTRYLQRPGRDHEPTSLVSHDAWTRLYKSSARDANDLISYYEKGDWIGVALDLELRLRSAAHGRQGSLVGVFRRLMESHGARDRGITPRDLVAAASAEAGEDMAWFFERHVDGTTPLDVPALVARMGVKVSTRAPWEPPVGEESTVEIERARTWSGLELSGLRVRNVLPGSPAAAAGVMIGDELAAVADRRVKDGAEVTRRIADHPPGARVRLALFRSGRLLMKELTLTQNPHRVHTFELIPDAELDPATLRLRRLWLGACEPAGPARRCVPRSVTVSQ